MRYNGLWDEVVHLKKLSSSLYLQNNFMKLISTSNAASKRVVAITCRLYANIIYAGRNDVFNFKTFNLDNCRLKKLNNMPLDLSPVNRACQALPDLASLHCKKNWLFDMRRRQEAGYQDLGLCDWDLGNRVGNVSDMNTLTRTKQIASLPQEGGLMASFRSVPFSEPVKPKGLTRGSFFVFFLEFCAQTFLVFFSSR
jgi:hypothetical protein